MISVLLADDHTIVRQGLKQILEDTFDIQVAGEASNGHDVLKKIAEDEFDVVVLDISMPGLSGLDVLNQLKLSAKKPPILILSMYSEDQYAVRFMKAGAAGYLTKERAPEELIQAIRQIHKGKRYITDSVAEKLASALSDDPDKPSHLALSDREYQVLIMIGSGMTPTQIAEKLKLSIKTVSTYRSRILPKMGLKNNSELTHYVIKNNLVQ